MRKPASKKTNAGNLKQSAGILVYRTTGNDPEVLLGHPGGPFWKNKDAGSWTIPKGEPEAEEDLAVAAQREFLEETGWDMSTGSLLPLTPVKQKSGKWIHAWMARGDKAAGQLRSNGFSMEWPPGSGRQTTFPEMDRFEWMPLPEARRKINPAQVALIDELEKKLNAG
jgi:predicted NUDIX family NTP pyrophosphohydrolase